MKLSAQVRSTHNQDGAIVLDILHGQMYRMNLVGSRMLELLKHGCAEAQIIEEISVAFGVPRATVESDLREFLAHLEKHHLIEPGQPETHLTL